MTAKRIPPMTVRLLGATALATVLALAPVNLTVQGPVDSAAFAKGGGDGGGGGGGGHGGGGDRGGGDRGGGDKGDRGGPDKGDRGGDKSAAVDRDDAGRGDRGRGHDVASRGRDFGMSTSGSVASPNAASPNVATFGRDFGHERGRDFGRSNERHDSRDSSRGFADRRDSSKSGNTLGNLNAAHASATARANASPNSMVGRIAAYETQMNAALAIQDRTARNAAIVAAREQLAQSANKPLTSENIAKVDAMLGIRGASPQLGAVNSRRDLDAARSLADRRDSAKNTLGNLNAAHASATARANASPNPMVGRIAAYETQMNAALAIQDRAARNAAIVAAREQLAQSANKPLTSENIARVDAMLGIRGASPQLGAVNSRRDLDRRDFDRRGFDRIAFDDDGRRDGRREHGFHDFGRGFGFGFGNLPVDPALIDARAAALDARGDRRAAEIRANADRVAAGIISRAEAKAAELRALEGTAKNPAVLEARAVAIVERANSVAAAIVAKADARATALNERVDDRVETLQAVAAYDRAVIAALALDDPSAQATAIAAARADLRAAIDRPISGRAIDRLDDRLGLDGTPTAVATRTTGLDG